MHHLLLRKSREQRGAAMITVVIIVLFLSLAFVLGMSAPVARGAEIARTFFQSTNVLLTAESAEEDVAYRIRQAMNYSETETLTLNGATATTTVTDDLETGRKLVATTAEGNQLFRKKTMELVRGESISFNYGVQAGNGGFTLKNSSLVRGNIYSNSYVLATHGNYVYGTIAAAGPTGFIDGVHATGSARAHRIEDSTVEGNAFYQELVDTVVYGTLYPGSPDPVPQPFPISDETIDEWQAIAEAGGSITSGSCPLIINSDITLGPVKINCGLEVRNGATVTLAGMVWVVGDIEVRNSSTIRLDPSLGPKSIAMIANNPANQTTSSRVIMRNSIVFQDSGDPNSYIMMISRNRNALDGGTINAISFEQTATGDVLVYSNQGKIYITNNSTLRQLTGYKIEIVNSAELIYEEGLANSIFDTGPGGSWEVFDWRESE